MMGPAVRHRLQAHSVLLSLLAEPTRVRLLALVADDELSVAELVRITELPQSRVSTHLGKLREASLVTQRREGASVFYREHPAMPEPARSLWAQLRLRLDDAVLAADAERRRALVASRERTWPDAVAGRMERYYSPGRTWEATARGFLGLMDLGDVLDAGSGDGTLAALIAPRARKVTCLDRSARVLEAARRRLATHPNVSFALGDLHALPFDAGRFDQVMLFNVLTYASDPSGALVECARVLRPAGRLALVTLAAHAHPDVTAAYGHLVPGFTPEDLRRRLEAAGLTLERCEVTSRERRAPHFEVISAFATRNPR